MTFETEFKPHFSIDKDYQTNAPTYYDYMAEVKQAMDTLYNDVSNAVDNDLVKELQSQGVLLQMTKEEVSPKRFKYTLSVKSDNTKEDLLFNEDGTISIRRKDGKTEIKAMSTQILNNLQLNTKGDGITNERTGNTITIGIDFNVVQRKMTNSDTVTINGTQANVNFDTVQEKLQAGDNIEIKGKIIRAVGDANVATKQDKITYFSNSALLGNQLYGLQAEGKVVTTNIGYLRKTGIYFINGDNALTTTASGARKNSIDTPTWERGWLIVHSAEGTDSCFQEFIPWHGYGRYWRTGSEITFEMPPAEYEKSEYEAKTVSLQQDDPKNTYFWSPWFNTLGVNMTQYGDGSQDTLPTKLEELRHGVIGSPWDNGKIKINPMAGNLYSKNGLYMGDPYLGYITCKSLKQRANLTFLPQSSYGNVQEPYASYGIKPKTQICYLLNWKDGKNNITAYDMQRNVAIKETELSYNGSQSALNWVRSSANIFVGRKQTYIVGTRVHQFWKWNETTNSLSGAMGSTPVTWNKTCANGSTTYLVGVSGDPSNDDYIYIMTEDRKALGGDPYKIATNAGDTIRVYKLDYTASSTSPTMTQIFAVTKPSNYFGGFCYHNGIFYIDYMDGDGSDVGVKLGKCFIYNATGELLDTIQFTGKTSASDQGTYNGEDTYINGCSIINVPRTVNEFSKRNLPADGLARDEEIWVTHSFFRKGVGQVVGRHPAYGTAKYHNEYEERMEINDGVFTKTGETEFVTWNDSDITDEVSDVLDEVPDFDDSEVSTLD